MVGGSGVWDTPAFGQDVAVLSPGVTLPGRCCLSVERRPPEHPCVLLPNRQSRHGLWKWARSLAFAP